MSEEQRALAAGTVEEKLCAKMSESALLELIENDDEFLAEIAEQAVRKLVEETIVRFHKYGPKTEEDSPALAAARRAADKAAENVIEKITGELFQSEEFWKTVTNLFVAALPQVMLSHWEHGIQSRFNSLQDDFAQLMRDRGGM